jgi:putative sigma-54 modulation protein
MNVLISSKGFQLGTSLREEVVEHVSDAFQRFEGRIREIRVFLSDDNGPKRGVDRSVQLVVDVENLPLVIIKEKGTDWDSTLVRATDRAVHSMARQVDRMRSNSGKISMAGAANLQEPRATV